MAIRFQFLGIKREPLKRKLIEDKLLLLFLLENKQIGELLIVITSDDRLLEVNQQFLHHNYYTDIITFDYSNNSLIIGELFISLDRIKENSRKFKTDSSIELQRVIIHGALHLIGYNDHSKAEKKTIRLKENYYLSLSF